MKDNFTLELGDKVLLRELIYEWPDGTNSIVRKKGIYIVDDSMLFGVYATRHNDKKNNPQKYLTKTDLQLLGGTFIQ